MLCLDLLSSKRQADGTHRICTLFSSKATVCCVLLATFSYASEETLLPNITDSGYLSVNKRDDSAIFYSYYESQTEVNSNTPILLWLQGGPGCAGHFGNFYELGPQWINANLSLQKNPGSWNRKAGLLVVDQPVGTGFSRSGTGRIPSDEIEIASDLYAALQDFFGNHKNLQERPFVVTGESYAGKYVPSLGHFIIQMERLHGLRALNAAHPLYLSLPQSALELGAPKFCLTALAIGNGLTDPVTQVQTHADTAFFQGLIDTQQRMQAMAIQLQVSQAIAAGRWSVASSQREALLEYLKTCIGAGTLLDYRRKEDYDSQKLVDKYLNRPEVKEHLGADENITFTGCSEEVAKVLGTDVMKSVKHVIPDLLSTMPLLLYQGAFDAQDGPATSESWIHSLNWHGRVAFAMSRRHVWRANADGSIPAFNADSYPVSKQSQEPASRRGKVLGYWRAWDTLTHIVIRDAGHMVPHDDSATAQVMVETWLDSSLKTAKKQILKSKQVV